MYCKNCGKKLPDSARFCDRCNTSVRKKSDKMDLIEELKEERLARQKVHRIEHRYKKMKQYKIRKHKKRFYFIIAVILLGIISGIWGYVNYIRTSGFNVSEIPVTTSEPDYTPFPTAAASISASAMPTSGSNSPSFSYTKVVVGGIEFEYPSFFSTSSDDEHLLSLYYTKDDAVLTFDREQTESSIKTIMRDFNDKISGNVLTSSSGDNWYSISKTDNNKIYHSCGKLINDRLIKYYMEFDASAENLYFSSLEYMDNFIKGD